MLLDEASVADYLRGRGVLPADADAQATTLAGGVSSGVLLVESGAQRLVVKQSLPRLRVAQEWLANKERILTEGAAVELTHALTPDRVPAVLDLDAERLALTIEAAPSEWRPWKELLLAGDADPAVASELGRVLARWHGAPLDPRFADRTVFDQLRVDPFYRTPAKMHPDIAAHILATAERMLASPRTFVHGDFSPKNVLAGDGGLWVIDHETAHIGDPAFDLAFMLTHLALKTIHRPEAAAAYGACAWAFLDAYGDLEAEYVTAHLGCLLLARVDGKSPADYLTEPERGEVRKLAIGLIRGGSDPLTPWH